MDIKQLQERANEIAGKYTELNLAKGEQEWTIAEYAQRFVGDVGDLVKLIMAKNNYRHIDDLDNKLKHELADCLWAVMVIAGKLNIDLEAEFLKTMTELDAKIKLAKEKVNGNV